MIHHYMQRGFTHDYLLGLPLTEQQFYTASMELYLEEEAAKWK